MPLLMFLSVFILSCSPATVPAEKEQLLPSTPIVSTAMYSISIQDTIVVDVSLPATYTVDSTAGYPALYLTDGYWCRGQHQSIRNITIKNGIKEIIIVGIGYPDSYNPNVVRVRDLLTDSGRLLDFILSQVIPTIDLKYRVNGERTLWGSSYGRFFAMYALFNNYGGTLTNLFGFDMKSFIDPEKNHYTVWEPALYEGVRMFFSQR